MCLTRACTVSTVLTGEIDPPVKGGEYSDTKSIKPLEFVGYALVEGSYLFAEYLLSRYCSIDVCDVPVLRQVSLLLRPLVLQSNRGSISPFRPSL